MSALPVATPTVQPAAAPIAPVLVPAPAGRAHARHIEWLSMTPFWLVHLASFGAIVSGVTWQAVALGLATYWIRMFGITGGYHRYFAHRTFRTSRWMQFALAFLAQTSAQRGALWWAAHHRHHHKASDTPDDVHSPRQDGFWYSHFLWVYNGTAATELDRIKDFARYPELRFLDRVWWLPPWVLGITCFVLAGWPGLFLGFFASTSVLWHCTFTINSLAHVIGTRRYATSDDSRNHWFLAFITMGEGWHNNHHHYQHSTRQGFFWWEIDATYYVLKAMSWVGLVWDLREPPARIRDAVA